MRRVVKSILAICAAVLFGGVAMAQGMMPSFKGGDLTTFKSWVERNAELTKEQKKIKGETQIVFYVNSEGVVEDVKVLKASNEEVGEIYRKAVENSPKWQPAKQNGKQVGVRMVLPIRK